MSFNLVVPPVGESVVEVTISEWQRKEGDFVDKDELVVTLDSEKTSFELPAPQAGVIKKIFKKAGETAPIGAVLAELEPGARPAAATPPTKPAAAPAAPAATLPPLSQPPAAAVGAGMAAAPVNPAARSLAAQHEVDLGAVTGTGRGGRVLKEDVQRTIETRSIPAPAPVVAPAPAPRPTGDRAERVVKMTPLRRTVAARLVQVQNEAAILTTFNEVDMSGVMALRERYKEKFTEKHGIKLGFMSFFVKAAIEALKAFPAVNAEIRGDSMVYKEFYDIGVAVGGGKGLVVPVVRDADKLSFAALEKTIAEYGKRARENKISMEELQGGTFTISNGGVYGSMLSTPILNPPQTGILGMHNIIERPVGVNGQIVLRPMMYLALSYDHRAIDGREAVQFLIRIKECIESPERLLLEV
ncbi:MAG: 2-oxoglutarate dehydrogenase complex dihydrolipoyllysine-residue succinyltransferase [Myxococcota bacterium]